MMKYESVQDTLCRQDLKGLLGPAFLPLVLGLCMFANPLLEAKAATVDHLVQQALKANPDLLASRQDLALAEARLIRARYLNQYNPAFEGNGTYWKSAGGSTAVTPSVTVSLQIEVANQRGKRIEEAEANLSKITSELSDLERKLKAQVKSIFFRALYAGQRLELFQRLEQLNLRLRDAAANRLQIGIGTKMDASLESIRYDQARRNTLTAKRNYQGDLLRLRRLAGMPPEETLTLQGSLAVRPAKLDSAAVLQAALSARPDIHASEAEAHRVKAQTSLVKRSIIPNPILSGFWRQEPNFVTPVGGGEQLGPNFSIAGGAVGFAIPVFDRKQAELAALAGDQRRATYNRRSVLLNVATEVRENLLNYEAAGEAVKAFESDVSARIEENLQSIESAYQAGEIDLLRLIIVENELISARLSYLDSLWDYWFARINLEYAVGRDLDSLIKP